MLSVEEILVGIFGIIILWCINDKYVSGRGLPPGPTRIPIIGTIALVVMGLKQELPHVTFSKWSKKYGPIMYCRFGSISKVIVDDPATIKEALAVDTFQNRPVLAPLFERSFGKPLGIVLGNGYEYEELRRWSTRTLRRFGFGKQVHQDVIMEIEMKILLEDLDEKLKENRIVSMEGFFTLTIVNIIWSIVAGIRFTRQDDPRSRQVVSKISNLLKELSVGGNNLLIAFPFLQHFQALLPTRMQNQEKSLTRLQIEFQDMLMERRREGRYKIDQGDFIDVFLAEIDKQVDNSVLSDTEIFTDQQLITTLIDLFATGFETTANSAEFAILFMILHPEVQAKVQKEIDNVVGQNRYPNGADRLRMPYTEATLYEIQRMGNTIPLIPRAPDKDIMLHSYKVKEGTFTLFNIGSYHRNPTIWKDPTEFNPERFLDENMKLINTEKLFVFGGGKRICLAENFARATLFNFIARLLQKYTFAPSPQHRKPTAENPKAGLSISPQPYFALVKPREF